MRLHSDLLELLIALSDAEARFLVVGGYAVGVHGHPRATKDLDIWVDPTPENAPRVMAALAAFKAPIGDLTVDDLSSPGVGFMMGRPPTRIDVLTELPGLSFEGTWPTRVMAKFGGLDFPVIGLVELIANKKACGRPQDLADVAALERVLELED